MAKTIIEAIWAWATRPSVRTGAIRDEKATEIIRPIPGWTPSTPEVRGGSIDEVACSHPVVAVHCWAEWDGYDQVMDRSIQAVAGRFADRVWFGSCNIDLEENGDFLKRCRVVSIPALLILKSGMPPQVIVGASPDPEKLANEIEARINKREPKPFWSL